LLHSILEVRKDLDRLLDRLIDTYQLDRADLVGFTSMFSQNVASLAMARKLKERNPGLITVMGGANCETPMGEEIVANAQSVDFVFSGPALESFPAFVQHQLDGDSDKCHAIPGVFSQTNCRSGVPGMPRISGSIGAELDLDVSVELDYETFLTSLEKQFPEQAIPAKLFFETSRGCWWGERAHCTFCGLNGSRMNYRAMSPKDALAQFESLFKFAGKCSELQCVDNIMPKEYMQEVFPLLEPPADISIFYEVKADLSDDDLRILSNAGVKRIQPGIEALSTKTLKLMKKGITAFRTVEFLQSCAKHGIHPEWNLLIGFPGEPEEVYRKYVHDLPLLTHLPPPTGAYPVRFDRYSPYFVKAEEYGLNLHPCDYYQLIYPFEKAVLKRMAYYFMDHNFDAEYFTTMLRWIGKIQAKIQEWKQPWQAGSGLATPRLHFQSGEASNTIYDSRSGKGVFHEVSDAGKRVLALLDRRKSAGAVIAELKQFEECEIKRELAWLQERGLLFEERGLLMSLVFPEDPRPEVARERTKPALVPISRQPRRPERHRLHEDGW
jgi:ribosomal peptide maturation radical SAM protein 1